MKRRPPAARLAASLALLTALTAPGLGRAGGTDPGALLERARRASGGDAWQRIVALHWRFEVESGGLTGTAETWEDVATGRWVDRFELGPDHGAEGFDGERKWSADASGEAHYEEAAHEASSAAGEAFRRSLSFWFPARRAGQVLAGGAREVDGRSFEAVRIEPAGGYPFELWIDPESARIERVVELRPQETRTTIYSDWRPVAGVLLPHASRSGNGDPRFDAALRVVAVEVPATLDDQLFQLPPPPAPDFSIAGGATSTTVPFELSSHHIYVEARLDGEGPFRMLVDTGGMNVITPAAAARLKVATEGKFEVRGSGEKSEEIAIAQLARLEVGAAAMERPLFFVFPLDALAQVEGAPLDGLVGYELLRRFVTTLDYERRTLTFTLPAAFAPPAGVEGIPFRLDDRTPQVDGAIDGLAGTFDLDTGSRSTLDLTSPFVAEHGLVERYGAKLEAVTGWGVGGPSRSLLARAGTLRLGSAEAGRSVVIERPVIELSLQKKGAFADPHLAGNVGGAILERFTVTFDYGNLRVWLQPNARAAEPFVHDRSGLFLKRVDDAFEIVDVVRTSPAAEAGLTPGDRILEIDGRPAAEWSLPDLRTRFLADPAGTRFVLRVDSARKAGHLTGLVLRDLL